MFREYQAPKRHGETFFEPSPQHADAILQENRRTLSGHDESWKELRRQARQQLVEDALRYTSAYRDVDWARRRLVGDPPPIVMAGHQPTLFHPGVWFKNFALSRLGHQLDALAINLVIDNDVAAGGSIRVPTTNEPSDRVFFEPIFYDRSGGGVPFEQATVGDREAFTQFDKSVRAVIGPIVSNPAVDQLWPHARAAIDRCGVAGCALAQARHGLEGDVGLQTLEIPMSVVCRGESFAQFAYYILSDLPRFHESYNDSAQVYRLAHRIRSSAHPVPDLHREQSADGSDWYEAPLWVYGNRSPGRRPVWAKRDGESLILSDRAGWSETIRVDDESSAVQQIIDFAGPECKLRPRALLTTMYARCVLSDLFLHGIGGGKYDQLGDMITRSFFRLEPTKFMVVSATIQLPGIQSRDYHEEIRRVRRRIRESMFQPEKFAQEVQLDKELLARKTQLLRDLPPRGKRQKWHAQMTQVNHELSASLGEVRLALQEELADRKAAQESQARLTSREHSFCLFPLSYLVETFDALLDDAWSVGTSSVGSSSSDQDLTDQ